jgi:hypothetical protein
MPVRSAPLALLAVALLSASGATDLSAQGAAATGPGRGGIPVQGAEPDLALLERFDRDRNQRLERTERDAARAYLTEHPELRPPMRGQKLPATGGPGPRLSPRDVTRYPASVPLYAPDALRTIFITFDNADWEREVADFWHTDVEVPATIEVDGTVYRDVGIGFRGNNSFHMIPDGLKRSFSINLDTWRKQDLLGHTSLNLLNANQDPSFLRSVLYLDIAREYIPAPKANFVRVVINGESWGLYVNQQTFSKALLQEQLGTDKGTRWKSPNNSLGGGFNYLGESLDPYRRWYEQKGKDDSTAWRALATTTRVLTQTPPAQLEAALAPLMDVDEVLKFLALDIALVNGDGYWNDGSDFNVLRGADGRFRALPHDANEAFRLRGNGASPDPLVALTDTNKALRSRLLAVPSLRAKYLGYVAEIAERQLAPDAFSARIAPYAALIGDEVARDTRKTGTLESFRSAVDTSAAATSSLRAFAERRRAALLAHPEIAGRR